MRLFLVVLLISLGIAPSKGQPVNQTAIDPKDSSEFLFGYFTRDILEKPPYNSWYKDGYENYKPDKRSFKQLKRKLPVNLQVFIVMGSWCSDSQREVPRLLSLLDQVGFDSKNLTCIAVDHQKRVTDFKIDHLKIEKVPTIIFYNNNKEGRIIESPKTSLEKDMLEIVKAIR